MLKTRDIVYINCEPEANKIWSMGIEFREFVSALPRGLNNVLLLQSGYYGQDFHMGLHMEFVRKENLDDLVKEDVYGYGDFCWIDFEDVNSLDLLEPQEIAELLYLGHLKQPLKSPWFPKLQNKFVYLAHDDGWGNRTYVRSLDDYSAILSNLIPVKLQIQRKRRIDPIDHSISAKLLSYAEIGLLFDFGDIIRTPREIGVQGYVIGKTLAFDDVYNNLDRYKYTPEVTLELLFKNNQWQLRAF